MPITSLPIEFKYNDKLLKGDCTIIDLPGHTEMPYKYPVYRLSFHNHRTKPDIYLFYETGATDQPFSCYPNSGRAPELLQALSKELEKVFLTN